MLFIISITKISLGMEFQDMGSRRMDQVMMQQGFLYYF